MTIIFNEHNASVSKAVIMTNALLTDEPFLDQIARHPSFDFSNATPQIVAELIRLSTLEFHVELFYPNLLNRLTKYRKTLAYTDKRFPNTLFLNVRKLNRSSESIAATIVHESIHALDTEATEYSFGHGNNSSVGKQNSAPYWIGNLAYRILLDDADAPLLVFDQPEEEEDREGEIVIV